MPEEPEAFVVRSLGPRKFREVERQARLSQWTWDLEADVIHCSPSLFAMHGLEPPTAGPGAGLRLPLQQWLGLLPENDGGRAQRFVALVRGSGEGCEFEYKLGSGRATRWLRLVAEVTERRDGAPIRVVGYTQDVTALKRSEQRHRRVQRELNHQHEALRRIACGEPLEAILASLCRQVERQIPSVRCSVSLLDRVNGVLRYGAAPTMPSEFAGFIDNVPLGEGVGASAQAAATGELQIVEDMRASPMVDFVTIIKELGIAGAWALPLNRPNGEVIGTFAVYRPVPHRPSQQEIQWVSRIANLAAVAIDRDFMDGAQQPAASIDPLTGLLNRTRFMELANAEIDQEDARWAVLYLDIERFKPLLDQVGYLAGERILAVIADRLRPVVGDELLARFGNEDVFVALIPADSPDAVEHLGERVLKLFDESVKLSGGEFFLLPLIGIAFSDGRSDAYGLVSSALTAMHAAQRDGLRRMKVYDRELRVKLVQRVSQESELRTALQRHELELHYQPLLDLTQWSCTEVEALVRWRHPTRGLVGPADFIPLAEEAGLIVPLGKRVLEMVVEQAREWRTVLPRVRIAANVAPMQLTDPLFADELLELIADAGLSPDAVAIEVTESALIEGLQSTHRTLMRLHEAGICAGIDDFGTGYSSLARLGDLAVTSLKIDRGFIARLAADSAARTVVRAISEIAAAYGLRVTAEGIEDAEALAAVEAIGCDFAQGFFIGRPVPAQQAFEFLRSPLPAHLQPPTQLR